MTDDKTVKEVWNLACPSCGSDSGIEITASVTCKLSTGGTDEIGSHEWSDDSPCYCNECNHDGTIKTFSAYDYVFDSTMTGLPRYTETNSGATLVRQPWMTDQDWKNAKSEFFVNDHTTTVRTATNVPIDWMTDSEDTTQKVESVTYADRHAQICTILAALRYYQEQGLCDPENRSSDIHDIATDGDCISLDERGIDELCEAITTGDFFNSVVLDLAPCDLFSSRSQNPA